MRTIKRIFKQGWKSWNRNKTVSASSIFILTVTLIIFSSIFLWQAIFNNAIANIKNKADISIYFDRDIKLEDENIKSFISRIEQNTLVTDLKYLDKQEAYDVYRQENINNTSIIKGLEFAGKNPFGDRVVIKTNNITDYSTIYRDITKDIELNNLDDKIYKINYIDIKDNIENLNNITIWFANISFFVLVIFTIMSILIIYNTTRISIFVFRNEIGVMKLVGASNFFIRGPFLVESFVSALVSSFITIIILYPMSYYLSTKSGNFLGGFDILGYYQQNIILLFIILFIFAITVSISSAYLATRKYLSV